jgi:hypothetical protein
MMHLFWVGYLFFIWSIRRFSIVMGSIHKQLGVWGWVKNAYVGGTDDNEIIISFSRIHYSHTLLSSLLKYSANQFECSK